MKSLPAPQAEQHEASMNDPEYFRAIGRLEAQVASLVTTVTEMKTKIDSLERMANRWKGGFTVILGVGAFIGYFIDHAIKWVTQR